MENNETKKTILILVIAIIVLSCCLIASCCAFSLYTFAKVGQNSGSYFSDSPQDADIDTIIESIIQENTEIDDANDPDPSMEGLTADEQKIIIVTEETRGLTAETKMAPVYKTEDELREELMEELAEVSDEDIANELGLYNILGFAPEDFDLRQFYVDLYTEQIAGFYDPEENAMYLVADISPRENALTLAHEYTHYLQYNHPEFDEVLNYDDDFCEDNGETCIIINSLTEGDASLTETLIDAEETILSAPSEQPGATSTSSSVYDNAPKFFQDSLLFPYVYGFDFVAYHYMKGGFDAVNDLYIKLPESVEQIMHPEKYLKDAPMKVNPEPFRSLIAKDFEIINDDVLNEADILQLLGSGYNPDWQLSERQAAAGAEGWGGGSYIFAKNDGKSLFFSKTVWDSEDEAKEAETTFRLYSDKRFGKQTAENSWQDSNGSSVWLIRQNDVLYWMILPDNFDSGTLVDMIRHGSAL